MYLIANTCGGELNISDLGLSLKPKAARDLHKLKLKIKPEDSRDLRTCIKLGHIKVLKKDSKKSKIKYEIEHKSDLDQKELLASIRTMIKEEVGNKTAETPDNQEVLDMLGDLKKLVKSKPNPQSTVIYKEKKEDDILDPGLDEDRLAEIHAKVVDRKTKNVEGILEYEDKEIVDNSIGNNITELSDLL